MRTHPPDAWLRETLKKKGTDRILEHIDQCARCKERLAVFATAGRFGRSGKEIDYGPTIERSQRVFEERQAALARERNDAPRLLALLMGLIPEQQQLLLRNSRRSEAWGLLELLIAQGQEEIFTDPSHAGELFRLALEVSGYLDPSSYGKKRLEDMRARVCGCIGNVYRVRMNLSMSEELFKEALARLRKGTGDATERAVLEEMTASLRRRQGRLDESVQLSHRAITTFKRNGQNHFSARGLMGLSLTYCEMGDLKKAFAAHCRSFDLLDPERDTRLALGALHNLTNLLALSGRLQHARGVLAQARPLYARFRELRWQSRHKWVEARIAVGLGRFSEAEILMRDVQDGFSVAGAHPERAAASRELASIRAGVWRAF